MLTDYTTALHIGPPALEVPALLLLAAGALGSALLLGLGLAAFARRGSRSYLLIVLALAALFGRSAVAGLAAANLMEPTSHHIVEHVLDVAMVALVIGAVYYARTVERDLRAGGRA